MNRQQFAEAVKKLDTSPYKITINASSDGAWRRGCFWRTAFGRSMRQTAEVGCISYFKIKQKKRHSPISISYCVPLHRKNEKAGFSFGSSKFPFMR